MQNFRTAYFDEDVHLRKEPTKIARNYAKGWLAIDVVACLPISYVEMVIEASRDNDGKEKRASSSGVRLVKILRLVRLAKLLRLTKLKRILKSYEDVIGDMNGVFKILGCCFFVLYICHIFACFWYYVGIMECEAVLVCPLAHTKSCPCDKLSATAEREAEANATEPALPWVVQSGATGWDDDTTRSTKCGRPACITA